MTDSSTRNAAIAAAVILAVVATAFLALPSIVISLGNISPWLGSAAVVIFIAGFFGIFWVRGRFQQQRRDKS